MTEKTEKFTPRNQKRDNNKTKTADRGELALDFGLLFLDDFFAIAIDKCFRHDCFTKTTKAGALRVVFSNSPCPYQCATDKRPKKSMPCRKAVTKKYGADFLSICLIVSTAHIHAISYLNALCRCFLVREVHGKKKENGKTKYICASSQNNKYAPSVFFI
jgi:hypothetical protein